MKSFEVEYNSNNSGGIWWLSDKDWKTLEEAGWKVSWAKDLADDDTFIFSSEIKKTGRWLGALATRASKVFIAQNATLAKEYAKLDWRNTVNQDPDEEGCSCCGSPHSFYSEEVKDA